MSQMPPFLRAYRQAMRDVQRTVLVHGQRMAGLMSTSSAVFMSADRISVPLRELRQSGAASLDAKAREQMWTTSLKETELFTGYLAGFDKAVEIVFGWGRKMNNPAARDAIAGIVVRLRNVRTAVVAEGPEGITKLRARKLLSMIEE